MEFRDAKPDVMSEKMGQEATSSTTQTNSFNSILPSLETVIRRRSRSGPTIGLSRMLRHLRREEMRANRLVTCARATKNRRRTSEFATFSARFETAFVRANSAKR